MAKKIRAPRCADCGGADGRHLAGCPWDDSGDDVLEEELEDLEGAGTYWLLQGLNREVDDAA